MNHKHVNVRRVRTSGFGLILMAMMCSMPSDIKETAWRTQITLPIGVTVYSFSHQLAMAGFNNFFIEGGNEGARPEDTLSLSKKDSVRINFQRKLFNLDSTHLQEQLGTATIRNSTPMQALMDLHYTGPINPSIPFHDTSSQALIDIYYALFDSSCPLLPVHVTNAYGNATLDSITIGILNKGALVAGGFIATLSPGQSATLLMRVAGNALDSVIIIDARGFIHGDGELVSASDGLKVGFSLDGMVVSKATIMDSLLDFTHRYEKAVSLSDSFNIDYIDFDTAVIEYNLITDSPVLLRVNGELRNLWDVSFCKQRNITALDAIAPNVGASDSADPQRYRGRLTADTLGKSAAARQQGIIKFGAARLFAGWDAAANESRGYYQFTASILATGRRLTFDKNDHFEADMQPVRFPFVAIRGRFQYEMRERGDPMALQTSLPWKKSIIDSLRGKFQFVSAIAPVQIRMDIADSSRIDSALLSLSISDPHAAATPPCSSTIAVRNVTGNSIENTTLDFTRLVNGFPDSLKCSFVSSFPAGCRVFLTNERDPVTGEYLNNFKLGAVATFAAKIPLVWKLLSTAVVILEDSKVTMDSSMKNFKSMRDREVTLIFSIKNKSNFMGVLYGVAAADADGKALLSLPDDRVDPKICATEAGKNFINLLGDNGVSIPKRDSTDHGAVSSDITDTVISVDSKSIISLDAPSIDRLLSAKELFIRWRLVLPVKDEDALSNGDKVTISSSMNIKGTMNSRTLIDSIQGR